MKIYLAAKHWQLFIVLAGSMLLAQLSIAALALNASEFLPVAMTFSAIVMPALFFGWIWAIAKACSKALPADLYSSPRPMLIGLIYAFAYLLLSVHFFPGEVNGLPGYIVAMHLLAMAAVFYAMGFTAKQLCKLEQGKKVSFFNYSGPLFLLWFFPIGVWFIQPKVNHLLGNDRE